MMLYDNRIGMGCMSGSLITVGHSLLFAAAAIHGITIDFDTATPGAVPLGWTVAMTHTGGPPQWAVIKDDGAPTRPNVFAQVSNDVTAGRFPMAVYTRLRVADGRLSVRFKTISGAIDQAAGLIWRYRDPQNYYIVRANALEDNVVLYKVENGERLALPPKGTPSRTYGVKHIVPKNIWNTLTVDFKGALFRVSLNGEALLDVVDSTFTESGHVGLWTKADSVTAFDHFQFTPAGRGRLRPPQHTVK
jgi:hypothetical protein